MLRVYENEYITVLDTKKNYDFRYVIINNTNNKINIFLNDLDDYLEINKKDWIGLFNGNYSDDIVNCLINKKYDYNFIYDKE